VRFSGDCGGRLGVGWHRHCLCGAGFVCHAEIKNSAVDCVGVIWAGDDCFSVFGPYVFVDCDCGYGVSSVFDDGPV
jgi:hypothetical protein